METLEPCRIDFIAREDVLKLLDRDEKACLGVAQFLAANSAVLLTILGCSFCPSRRRKSWRGFWLDGVTSTGSPQPTGFG